MGINLLVLCRRMILGRLPRCRPPSSTGSSAWSSRLSRCPGLAGSASHGFVSVQRSSSGSSLQTLMAKGDISARGVPWHFLRATELTDLAESCSLISLGMAGCEGLSAGLPEAANLLAQDQAKWGRWPNRLLDTSAEPAVVDLADHMLYVGRNGKPSDASGSRPGHRWALSGGVSRTQQLGWLQRPGAVP